MTPNRSRTSFAAIAAVLLSLAVVWVMFAPATIGGRVSYVIVNGNSMEPGLHKGDLVLVRHAATYQVGDVVTYQHPSIGPVIHRIVDRTGDRFILQGDNNGWLDSYHPATSEIAGAQWLHIPRVGTAIAWLRGSRLLLLLAAIVAGVLIVASSPKRTPPSPARPDSRPQQPSQFPGLDTASRDAAATLVVIMVACLALVVYSFTRPDQRPTTVNLTYQHSGAFSYTAAAPSGIYDGPGVTTGAPIFREITDRVSIAFDYRFSTAAVADIAGTWSLHAIVSNTNGWQRTVPLSGPHDFSGSDLTATGDLDLAAIQELIDSVVAQTGVRHDVNTIAIHPEIDLTGAVAGQPLQDRFAPTLAFRLDEQQLRLVDGSSTNPAALAPTFEGALSLPGMEPNRLALLGWEISLSSARVVAVSGLALSEILLLCLLVQIYRARHTARAEHVSAAPDVQVIAVTNLGLTRDRRVVTVACFEDLALLAARANVPVLFRQSGRVLRYVVHVGAVSYAHVTEQPHAATPAPHLSPASAGALP